LKNQITGSSDRYKNVGIKKKITFLDAPDVFPKSPATKVNKSQAMTHMEIDDTKNSISKLIDRSGA